MKTILLTLIFLTIVGCENKPKKVISEKIKENSKLLEITFSDYQIEFITKKSNSKLLEKPRIENDTLNIFGPDINELESIKVKGLKANEVKISQMYESSLILQFDGKAFEMKNWKVYKSEWFYNTSKKNIRKYSKKDYAKFPEYNRNDLLKALNINKKNISEHWYNFAIENLGKQESEIFFEPIINKTIFKIEIIGKDIIYVKLKHMIGC